MQRALWKCRATGIGSPDSNSHSLPECRTCKMRKRYPTENPAYNVRWVLGPSHRCLRAKRPFPALSPPDRKLFLRIQPVKLLGFHDHFFALGLGQLSHRLSPKISVFGVSRIYFKKFHLSVQSLWTFRISLKPDF